MESSFKQDPANITKGLWQWKSNSEPWSKTQPPQWESYSLKQNYRIEKAYYDQQEEIDIGEYIISIKHMIQKKKDAVQSQRPIRRIDFKQIIKEIGRSQRYFESELPKTINNIFGGLGDFISFFSRRNQEILDLASHFQDLEKSNDLDILHHKIIPKLIQCLEETLLKPLEEQLKNSSLSKFQNKTLSKVRELISEFDRSFSSLEEFYGKILKAYTMNTGLYPDLNKYLRNENWMEVDKLLPYALCLCKAFFNPNLRKINSEQQTSRILYRGTEFDEFALSFYDKNKIQYFSWNAVTSTTTNKDKAEDFMYQNADIGNKRYPVMFIIEIPDRTESEEYLKWLDIRQYSAIPKEDEVILPPGSAFELLDVFTDQDKKTTIKIKLKNEVRSLAQKGLMMQGKLQSQMMTEKEAKIVCLEEEALSQALLSLEGNRLIEDIEFCLCTFNNRSLNIMTKVLSTLSKAQRLKFLSCTYQDKENIHSSLLISEDCKISTIEIEEVNDFYKLFTFRNEDNKNWRFLTDFSVIFRNRVSSIDGKMDNKWLQGLQFLPNLASLTLDLSWFSEEGGPYNLTFEGLESLTQLTSLTLKLSGSQQITDDGVYFLASQALSHLKKNLRSLAIHLYDCAELTDKGVESLAFEGLRHLSKLTSLSIDIRRCKEITNKGISSLASHGLRNLPQLTCLNLYFNKCPCISDQCLHYLAAEGLKYLTQLKVFSLRLSSYYRIQDEGIKSLASEGLEYLTQLTSLTLRILPARLITSAGIGALASEGLEHLKQLTSLTLDFTSCHLISDFGMKKLAQGLQNLTELTSLGLRFSDTKEITNEGLCSLTSEGLSRLVQLTSLSLDLSGCMQIKNEGLESLAVQGLKQLTNLTSLALYFSSRKLSESGIQSLASEGLGNLTKLTSLTLRFANCGKISDEELNILGSKGLKNLKLLTFLTLEFAACDRITDEGAHHLATFGLNHLVQLNSLTLEFSACSKITDKGVHRLASQLLKHLDQLIFIPKGKRKLRLMSNSNSQTLWTQQILEPPKTKHLILRRDLDNYKKFLSEKDFIDLDSQNSPSDTPNDPYSLEISQHSEIFLEADEASVPKKGILQPVDMNVQNSFDKTSQQTPKKPKITDEKLHFLATQKLRHLTQLTSLSLNFERCQKITDKGLFSLAFEGLRFLTQLKSLSLYFNFCRNITDAGILSLAENALKNLKQLTSLTLNFNACSKISNKGLYNLAFYGLKHLHQLTSLSLDFKNCIKIKNVGLQDLALEGLKNLSQLQSLALCFCGCRGITDSGLKNLSQGLKHLNQLTSLSLDFSDCVLITGLGVQSLASQGLKHLNQLISLSLNFSFCNKITDQGVSRLECEGLRYLPRLISLDLNFGSCQKITSFSLSNIIRVLYYFEFLML